MAPTRLDSLRQQSRLSIKEELHGTFYCVHTQPKFGATFLQGWLYVFDSAIIFYANLLAVNRVQCIIPYENIRVIRKRTLLRINNTIAVEWEDAAGTYHYDIITNFLFGSRGKAFDAMMEQWRKTCSQASMQQPRSQSDSSGGSSSSTGECTATSRQLNSSSTSSGWSHLLIPLKQRQAGSPQSCAMDAMAESAEDSAAAIAAATAGPSQSHSCTAQDPTPPCHHSAAVEPRGTETQMPCHSNDQPDSLHHQQQQQDQYCECQQPQHCESLQGSDSSDCSPASEAYCSQVECGRSAAAVDVSAGTSAVGWLVHKVTAATRTAMHTLCNSVLGRCVRHTDSAAQCSSARQLVGHIPGCITVLLGMQLLLLWYMLLAMHRVVLLHEQIMQMMRQQFWDHIS